MPTETSYTSLRENVASILDQVVDQQEIVIVRRKGLLDAAKIRLHIGKMKGNMKMVKTVP